MILRMSFAAVKNKFEQNTHRWQMHLCTVHCNYLVDYIYSGRTSILSNWYLRAFLFIALKSFRGRRAPLSLRVKVTL